ncbi:DUF2461 domain-containing protein [Sphingobacterium bovistauri]|uniref:DUF2461 domain-containing protein n=1 Tax=Sphingobacterium bovistauri TaxID=2781959 RepID=A0ABS7ZCZ1_9SPHI|nr:DUF2461 domain-containing protein [Sphingobacterium bovistauri]MCA5006599.1 DUF2461 domain-containing protein [Sphingobacterium bovistauri]
MNIAASTFKFLKSLEENNNREWFNAHKDEYELARANVEAFIQELINKLSTFDPHIESSIKAKKCMFRIYRDVRFSKDKSPYKTWFAAGISLDGRKLDGPEYYMHVGPGNSFIAVGYWRPKKEHLDNIRQEIDYNLEAFEDVLNSGNWTSEDLSQDDKLVRPPTGYTEENDAIEFLKLKSFIIFKPLEDKEVLKPFALEDMVQVFQRSLNFKNFLHDAIAE